MTTSAREYLAQHGFGSMLGQTTIHALQDADTGLLALIAVSGGVVVPMPIFQGMVLGHLHHRPHNVGVEEGDRVAPMWSRLELPRAIRAELRSGVQAEIIAGRLISEVIIRECSADDEEERKAKVYAFIKQISDKQREAKRDPVLVTGLEDLFDDLPKDHQWTLE